jgi:SNF2 family DNA or RNA helicase
LPEFGTSIIKPNNYTIILDEAHYAKGWRETKRAKVAEILCERAERCWALTGTPLPNDPDDLWGLLSVIGVGPRIGTHWDYESWVVRNKRGKALSVRPEFRKALEPFILRRTKEEVLDLPDKIKSQYLIDQKDLPDPELLPEMTKAIQPYGGEEGFARFLMTRKSIPRFTCMATARKRLAAAKGLWLEENLLDAIERTNPPVVVFSCHRDPIDRIGQRPGWEVITGESTTNQRRDVVQRVQSGLTRGLAMTTAGAEGITLTRANTLIRIDLDWTLGRNLQVESRLHRWGQTRDVNILDLVANHPLDTAVYKVLDRKRTVLQSAGLM